jgi:hypothetical protein
METGPCLLAQQLKIQSERHGPCALQAAEPFPEEHGGSAPIAALQVQVRHGDLKDSLQHLAARALGFMPELLETVVAGVPLTGIEKPDGLPEAGINHQALFL